LSRSSDGVLPVIRGEPPLAGSAGVETEGFEQNRLALTGRAGSETKDHLIV